MKRQGFHLVVSSAGQENLVSAKSELGKALHDTVQSAQPICVLYAAYALGHDLSLGSLQCSRSSVSSSTRLWKSHGGLDGRGDPLTGTVSRNP